MTYALLFLAIVCEVIATTSLKQSQGFTRLLPAAITLTGYAVAFYLLSLTLRTLPVGIVYAVWSGAGTALVALIGWTVFKQHLDTASLIGIGLILAGVLTLNLLSGSTA